MSAQAGSALLPKRESMLTGSGQDKICLRITVMFGLENVIFSILGFGYLEYADT